MKAVVYAPAAPARFADILEYAIQNLGGAQADACTAQLAARIEALAAGTGPRARCGELLMQGVRDAAGLTWGMVGKTDRVQVGVGSGGTHGWIPVQRNIAEPDWRPIASETTNPPS